MNPDEQKPTPVNSPAPSIPTPEESASLNAIESEDVTKPLDTEPASTPAPATPVVSSPLSELTSAPPTPVADTPVTPNPSTPAATPTPSAPASSSEPAAPNNFQPFASQKKSPKKGVIVLVIILALAILGFGGYFGWQYFFNQPAAPAQQTQPEETEELVEEPTLEEEIIDFEEQLNAIDDSEYQDSTLSDETLLN